jgi:hypothetical protein
MPHGKELNSEFPGPKHLEHSHALVLRSPAPIKMDLRNVQQALSNSAGKGKKYSQVLSYAVPVVIKK